MARRYHSPSSIALGMRCRRAWAYTYIDGVREPDRDWNEIKDFVFDPQTKLFVGFKNHCTTRQRSTSLGKAMHGVLEDWYLGGEPDWGSFPGQVAHSGTHLLPHPEVTKARVEEQIGRVELPHDPNARADGPTRALEVHGVRWAGLRDLLAYAPEEFKRLGIDAPDGWALLDYKSTANIKKYALTPAELERNSQSSLYTIDACAELGLSALPAGWVYFESKKVRRAVRTDAHMTVARALDVLGPCAELAKELDTYTQADDAPQNPLACGDYGPPGQINCPHHKSNGGPCNARRSIGALVQARIKPKKDTNIMALDPAVKAKFAALKAVPSPAPVETTAEPVESEPPPVPAAKAPAKPRAAAKAKISPAPVPVGSVAAILELQTALAEAQAAKEKADANLEEVLGLLRAALA